jgi:amino-acid N-acetyltransferase
MVIEAATDRDLDSVRRLLERHQLPLDGVDDQIDTTVVARDGPTVLGTAAVELYADGALLRSVAVDPSVQGRHLGRELTEGALRLATANGIDTVYLLTTTAQHYFPKLGFEPITRDQVPVTVRASVEFRSACPASAVVMRKRLVGR